MNLVAWLCTFLGALVLVQSQWCYSFGCGHIFDPGHLNNQTPCVSSHLLVMPLVHGHFVKTLALWSHLMALFMYIISQVIFQKSNIQVINQNNWETTFWPFVNPFQSIPCHFKPFHVILHQENMKFDIFDQLLTFVNNWLFGQLWPKSIQSPNTLNFTMIINTLSIYKENTKKWSFDLLLTLVNNWLFWSTLTKVNLPIFDHQKPNLT